MTNAVRDAFAIAQAEKQKRDEARSKTNEPGSDDFAIEIKLTDGTTLSGKPYPIEPGPGEAVRLATTPDNPDDPGDVWIAAIAIVSTRIVWTTAQAKAKPSGKVSGAAGSAGGTSSS